MKQQVVIGLVGFLSRYALAIIADKVVCNGDTCFGLTDNSDDYKVDAPVFNQFPRPSCGSSEIINVTSGYDHLANTISLGLITAGDFVFLNTISPFTAKRIVSVYSIFRMKVVQKLNGTVIAENGRYVFGIDDEGHYKLDLNATIVNQYKGVGLKYQDIRSVTANEDNVYFLASNGDIRTYSDVWSKKFPEPYHSIHATKTHMFVVSDETVTIVKLDDTAGGTSVEINNPLKSRVFSTVQDGKLILAFKANRLIDGTSSLQAFEIDTDGRKRLVSWPNARFLGEAKYMNFFPDENGDCLLALYELDANDRNLPNGILDAGYPVKQNPSFPLTRQKYKMAFAMITVTKPVSQSVMLNNCFWIINAILLAFPVFRLLRGITEEQIQNELAVLVVLPFYFYSFIIPYQIYSVAWLFKRKQKKEAVVLVPILFLSVATFIIWALHASRFFLPLQPWSSTFGDFLIPAFPMFVSSLSIVIFHFMKQCREVNIEDEGNGWRPFVTTSFLTILLSPFSAQATLILAKNGQFREKTSQVTVLSFIELAIYGACWNTVWTLLPFLDVSLYLTIVAPIYGTAFALLGIWRVRTTSQSSFKTLASVASLK